MPCSAAADLVVPCGCHREFCEFRSQDSCTDASNNIFANIARNYQNRYAKSPGNTHMSMTPLTFLWHDTSSVNSAIRQKKRGCIYCRGFFLVRWCDSLILGECVLFSVYLCYVLECFRWELGPSTFDARWLQTVCIVWDLPFPGQ